MKLLDRYMLRTFLVPLTYCLLAFALISVLVDLFDNIGDFLDAKTPFLIIVKYYVILLPSILYRIVPIAVMLAVIYSLYQLSKNNELTAMRACGISLNRLMVPYILAGLVISTVVLVENETIGPDAAYWCHRFVREQRKDPRTARITQIAFKKERNNRIWNVRFDTKTFELQNVEITQMRTNGPGQASKIRADGGQWLDSHWVMTNVTIQTYDEDGAPHGAAEVFSMREMSEFNEKPDDFLNEVKDPEYLSSSDLLKYVRSHRVLEPQKVASIRTDYHNRLAFPWASFIVVLMGIPVGTHTGRKGVMPAVAMSLGMLAGYYGLMMIGLALGKGMVIPPWLAGWLPIMTFLGTGTILVARLR